MSGLETDYVQCITKTQFNPASLTGSYQVMNGTGMSDNVKIFKMYNGSTTVSIDISFDGVIDHDFMPPMGTLIVDFQAGHYSINGSGVKYIRLGQFIWGKTAAQPTWLQMIGYR